MKKKKDNIELEDTLFDEEDFEESEDSVTVSGKFLGLTDDELVERIHIEYNNGYDFRKPNILEWHENENLLYGKKPKTLSKRSNIMIQLMAGFEDTLLSKIKQPVLVVFKPTELADKDKARKVTSAWQLESSVSHEDWEYKDLLTKKLAMVSGRGILKIHARYPYAHRLDPIDHYDFIVDPLTNGMTLESARYLGQDNIILSKYQLEHGNGYIKEKVKELINSYADNNSEIPDNTDQQKSNRFVVVGMNYQDYFQAGDASFKLLEWYTTINGIRAVVLLDLNKKIIIKKKELKEVTSPLREGDQPFWPYESWAYYPDLFNFWSPAPMSRVRELFQLRNVSLNQMFDNNEAKNKPSRAYDPKIYTNPSLLTYSPDRLIPVAPNRDPSKGLYTLPVNDIIEPQHFDTILEKLSGKITGVNSDGAGMSDTEKVGIYYGDQQNQEKRMTLFEISYNRCHLKLGQKYLLNLSDKLDKKASIKILGEDGAAHEDLTQEDLGTFDIGLTGGMSQATEDALEKKTKNDFLKNQLQNPFFNKKFQLELGLALNGFNKDDIKRALEPVDVDEKQSIRASQDIQNMLLGKKFRPFLKAEVSYLQKIFDYIYDNELEKKDEEKLMAYLDQMQPIVLTNMMNKARAAMASKGMLKMPDEFAAMANQGGEPGAQPNNDINSQAGLDQSVAQTVPAESQETYVR